MAEPILQTSDLSAIHTDSVTAAIKSWQAVTKRPVRMEYNPHLGPHATDPLNKNSPGAWLTILVNAYPRDMVNTQSMVSVKEGLNVYVTKCTMKEYDLPYVELKKPPYGTIGLCLPEQGLLYTLWSGYHVPTAEHGALFSTVLDLMDKATPTNGHKKVTADQILSIEQKAMIAALPSLREEAVRTERHKREAENNLRTVLARANVLKNEIDAASNPELGKARSAYAWKMWQQLLKTDYTDIHHLTPDTIVAITTDCFHLADNGTYVPLGAFKVVVAPKTIYLHRLNKKQPEARNGPHMQVGSDFCLGNIAQQVDILHKTGKYPELLTAIKEYLGASKPPEGAKIEEYDG